MGIIDSALQGLAGGITGGAATVGEQAGADLAVQRQIQLAQATSDIHTAAEQQIATYQNNLQLSNAAAERTRHAGYAGATPWQTAQNATAAGEAGYGAQVGAEQNAFEKIIPFGSIEKSAEGDYNLTNSVAKQNAMSGVANINAQGKVDAAVARSAANAANTTAVQKMVEGLHTSAWGTTDVTGKPTPHPGADETYHNLALWYAGQGINPSQAIVQASLETKQLTAAAQADVTNARTPDGQPMFKPGTPEFEEARTARLDQYTRQRINGANATPAPSSGATPAPSSGASTGTLGAAAGLPAPRAAAPSEIPEPANVAPEVQAARSKAILTGSTAALERSLRTPGYSAAEQQALKAELNRRNAPAAPSSAPENMGAVGL
jgi:hypothetical protein